MFEHLFDPTIHLSDLLMIGGTVIAVVKLMWKQQQQNEKILELLGQRDIRERRTGILGDIQSIEEDLVAHVTEDGKMVQQIQEIRLALGFDRRAGIDRRID